MIAALYIDPRGPYPKMPGVEAWDETKDARGYAGPWPVVAHPPCGPWASLKHLDKGLSGGKDCAIAALEAVRAFGGILEHPAHSGFWRAANLPDPGHNDSWGFTVEVEQVSWGHVARKRTWLYMVDIDRTLVASTMRTGGTPTHWVSGGRKPRKDRTATALVPPGIKVCSAQQRRRSPPEFAAWLVMLAASVQPASVAA